MRRLFHYCDVDPDTGEILSEITPEFIVCRVGPVLVLVG